jgi:polygalacturonase
MISSLKNNWNLSSSGFLILFLSWQIHAVSQDANQKWDRVDAILDQIEAPDFKDQEFTITDFGAKDDNRTNNAEAINKAIKTCSECGGGRVIVPAGEYLTGPLILLTNVNLHLEEGAILKFSTYPDDYLPVVLTRWEGVDCYNYSPLIYAYQQENIAITGKGILDGQADTVHWWHWKAKKVFGNTVNTDNENCPGGRELLMQFEEQQIPLEKRILGKDHNLRPPFIQFYECKNILIEDITISNSPFWLIHPLLSENITIRRYHANSEGPNNDGLNPESSKNILIEECIFNTGDDCIAIKSGRNNDGRKWNIPSKNIIIRNCEMQSGHGGVVIGSEISGGCSDVFVYDCKMNSPVLDRAIRIKTNAMRGGIIENVYVKNIEIGQVKEAVLKINCIYETKSEEGDHPPLIRNIYLDNITSQKSKYPIYIVGLKKQECIHDIYIKNSHFNGVTKESRILYVNNLSLENVYLNGKPFSMKK